MTLGYQYNWTSKTYPEETPGFPKDLARIIRQYFGIESEAAIVNFYSRGNRLSGHVDQSEACNAPLVSLSFGLDAVFVVAQTLDDAPIALRLRHGDVVVMKDRARFVAHGICQVCRTTDSIELDGIFKDRRININVRQRFGSTYHHA